MTEAIMSRARTMDGIPGGYWLRTADTGDLFAHKVKRAGVIGNDIFDQRRAQGEAMQIGEAVAYARAHPDSPDDADIEEHGDA